MASAKSDIGRTAEPELAAATNEINLEDATIAPEYLSGWALKSLAMALMFSSFVLGLDNSILATAIPQIIHDFHSLNDIGWYAASFLLTQISFLPSCGRFYTFYSIKWTYIIMLLIFVLGSTVCALAPNSIALIVGRALAGLGAAGLLSGATVILSYCIALEKRAFLLALIFGVYGVGSVTGPLVGGAITDNKTLSWRFIFWFNLLLAILRNPPPPVKENLTRTEKLRQIDIGGALLLIGGIASLLLALQWGGTIYPWSNPKVFGTLIGFGVILTVFIFFQIRDQVNCTIPIRIFRSRTVCAACAFILFIQIAMVAQTYYWPIYFQSVKNTNAETSGIFILPLIISNSLVTVITGWATSKLRHYVPFTWIGPPILAAGSGLFQLIRVNSSPSAWIGYQILSGAGYGLCNQMAIIAVQVVLDKVDVPTGCVMVIFFQGLGGILATSIGQNLFNDRLLRNLHHIAGLDAAAVVKAGANGFRAVVPADSVGADTQAYNSALKEVFLITLATPIVALVVSTAFEWEALKRALPRKQASE
ncbi:major facilitator superfamily domain-containing protein [Xylariaceae sp. FL1651]|nr:major facilitator superfamily domain-containing protein [Xylariaceae sp. FL1651]